MAYIITTRKPRTKPIIGGTWLCPESRHAVATPEDARDVAEEIVQAARPEDDYNADGWGDAQVQAAYLPESGGTIGPLPDGTVIEVEQTTVQALASAVGYKRGVTNNDLQAFIDAFNEREVFKR